MTAFIGIEYLVANAFIYSIEQKNQRSLTTDKIFNYQRTLMNYWNMKNIDALIHGGLSKLSMEYKDYFTLFSEAHLIVLNDTITLENLKEKFFINSVEIQNSFKDNANALF